MKLPLLLATVVVLAQADPLDQARAFYQRTEYQKSLQALQAVSPKTPEADALTGRDYFMLGEFKKATDALGKAVGAEPGNSDYVLWLARAWGRRAEMANPVLAISQASKARQYFEKAVELNPQNLEALNDLLEFYLEAPGFLGGGIAKAREVVAKIGQVDPAEGHWAQSKIDEKQKELGSAEQNLRRAAELAPHQVSRLIDLARFLAKEGHYQESDQNFARAEQIAPHNPKLMYIRAEVYVKSHRNLDVAKTLLQQYLASNVTPDDPPKADAEKLLQEISGS